MSAVVIPSTPFPVRLEIDFPDRPLNQVTSAFRIVLVLPIAVLLALIPTGLMTAPVGLMLLFQRKYPRWWFDWQVQLQRFETRVCTYAMLLDDRYPSTDEEQSVHLDIDYPDAARDLNRWLPLVKWVLAIPHFLVLIVLVIGMVGASIGAWFVVVFTGRYPRPLFNYIVGVMRWASRVSGYAFTLVTDRYPPFSLKP